MPYKISIRVLSREDKTKRIEKLVVLIESDPNFKKRMTNFENMKFCYRIPLFLKK